MVLIRVKELTFNFGRGGSHGSCHVARLVTNKRLLRAEALLQILRDRLAGNLGVGALVPFNSHRLNARLGLPERIGDDGHCRFPDSKDVPDAFHLQGFCTVKRFKLATKDRALPDRGIQHAGELKVDPVDSRAIHFVACIQATDSLPDYLPDFRIFQNDFSRYRQLGGRLCDCTETDLAPGRSVCDHAIRSDALVCRNTPGICSSLHQHHSRRGTALSHVFVRVADPATAASRETTPHPFTSKAFTRGWIFGRDLGPVAFEFFGNQLSQTGQRALPHLGTNHPNYHGVIRTNDDPRAYFG